MVVTQQFRTVSSSRQLLRPVQAHALDRAIPRVVSLPAPRPAWVPLPAAALHVRCWTRQARHLRWAQRQLTVPYWIIAVMLVSTLAGSLSLAWALRPAPPAQSAAIPMPFTTTAPTAAALSGSASGAKTGSATAANDTAQQLEDLRAALAAVAADLDRAQRSNAQLRDEAKRGAAALASTTDRLALAQQNQQGQLQDSQAQGQAQLQDMQARYDALTNDVQSRLSSLEQKVAAAEQTAAKLRGALGLPQAYTGAAGGPPVSPADAVSDPVQRAEAEMATLDTRVDALDRTLAAVSDTLQASTAQLKRAGLPISGDPAADAAYIDKAPLGKPVNGVLTSSFGYRADPFSGTTQQFHTGIDLAVPEGTKVAATGGGVVRIAGWYGGYGNLVMIDHGRGVTSYYGHNSQILVTVGQRVSPGDVIALSGNTGYSTGPHVHYELRLNDVPFDPQPLANLSH